MAESASAKIQLCGRLAVQLDGQRIEGTLPGAKGRLLFGFLVLNRAQQMSRESLLIAVYGDDAAPEQQPALSVLLSKLRAVVGSEILAGRSQIELRLPRDAFVDVEAALEAIHRAESHSARGEYAYAWGPAGVAYHVTSRPLLQGHDAPWLDRWRRRLEDVRVRGLECLAAARLELGAPTLAQAEDCARQLVELAPYRETGHRILMEALERRGNIAEALRAYERLRVLLSEELGIEPSPDTQTLYRRLLGEPTIT